MNINNYKPNSELTKEILKENNFRYIDGIYSYRFPVYSYNKIPLLWCFLYIDIENNSCNINVLDNNDNTYASFFNRSYGGRNMVVESIDRKINTQLRTFVKLEILKKRGGK